MHRHFPHSISAGPVRLPAGVEPHDVSHIEATKQGMAVHIAGPDPYIFGPAREYPAGTPLFMKIRLKSSEGGSFHVFYFGSGQESSEEHSVRFAVRRGDWQEQTVPLPPMAPGFRLRLDPPGERGVCLIESIRFTPRLTIAAPAWPKPTVPERVPGHAHDPERRAGAEPAPARVGRIHCRRGWTAGCDWTQSAPDRLS